MTHKGSWNRNNPSEINSFFCKVCGFGPKSCKCEKPRKGGKVKKQVKR
jgi:hypothetical protein